MLIQKAIETAVNKALGVENDNITQQKLQIVVLQRGWVVVGMVAISGDDVTIGNTSVIRVWGTTKGLGEIALNGPTNDTVLDPCGVVHSHKNSVVLYIDCVESNWAGKLP
ncbi:MAG: hypothetical protein EBR82_64810 [Caulobacteraceae bacterium]|nr:hypothetical protein [Caulobacteraceae bacterium]